MKFFAGKCKTALGGAGTEYTASGASKLQGKTVKSSKDVLKKRESG